MDDHDQHDQRKQARKEVRTARICLLVVTLLVFTLELATLYVIKGPQGLADAPPEEKRLGLVFAFGFLAVFGTLWILSKHWPKVCLILALVLFWALQLLAAAQDGSQLYSGLLLKLVFTVLLVKGIRSASRAEAIAGKDLGRVFE